MKMDAELVGARELTRAVKRAEAGLDAELKAANLDNADEVKGAVRVPRRSGDLDDTLRTSGTARWSVVRVGTKKVAYAPPIHWGWPRRNIKPQPFLYEALDSRIGSVMKRYEATRDKLVDIINSA